MDCFSEKTDMKVEDDPVYYEAIDYFSEKNQMEIEAGPIKDEAMEFSFQKPDIEVEDSIGCDAMDISLQKADMKVLKNPTVYKIMDFSLLKAEKDVQEMPAGKDFFLKSDMKVEEKPILYGAKEFSLQNGDIKLQREHSHYEVKGFSFLKADKKLQNDPALYGAKNSSQKTHMRVKGKPATETSSHDLHSVQRIRKRKQRRESLSFKPYILRVKKAFIPQMQLSSSTLDHLDDLIYSVYEKYSSELERLFSHTKKRTLSAKNIESATKLCVPGKLKDKLMIYARKKSNFQKVRSQEAPKKHN